jgi:hypothetical protein
LESELFDNDEAKSMPDEVLILLLCRLLRCQKGSFLPSHTHEIEPTCNSNLAAMRQHYAAVGGLDLVGPKTLDNLKRGYYVSDDTGKIITCTVDRKEVLTKIDLGHCCEVKILNPLDVTTEIEAKSHGTQMRIDTVFQEMLHQGVPVPQLEVDWKGALFGTRRKVDTQSPAKRKAVTEPEPALGASAFASKSGALLQNALRRKMTQSDGSSAAGSGAQSSKGEN